MHDNTLWTIGGPLKGWRYYVTGGPTIDFQGHGFDNTLLQIDVRRYLKLSSRVAFAVRYVSRNAWGGDEQLFYLGGPWTLRGYPYNEFFGKSMQLVQHRVALPAARRASHRAAVRTHRVSDVPGGAVLRRGQGVIATSSRSSTRSGWGRLGTGIELNLGFAPVIRVNFTWPTNFDTISSNTGFELFIGYNY